MTLDGMPDEDFLIYLEWRLEAARIGTPQKPFYWRRCPVPIPWDPTVSDDTLAASPTASAPEERDG